MSKEKIMSLESLPNELLLDIFNRVIFSDNLLIKDKIRQWFRIVGTCKRLRTLVMTCISSVYTCVAIEHRIGKIMSRLIGLNDGGIGMPILYKTECLHLVSSVMPIATRKKVAKMIHDTACNHLFTIQTMGQYVPRCSGCKWGKKTNLDILFQYSKTSE